MSTPVPESAGNVGEDREPSPADAILPWHVDHVGSLLRPARLLRARDRRARGEIDADELRASEDETIQEAVRMQRDAGLATATDGEFRRSCWDLDFLFRVRSLEPADQEVVTAYRAAGGDLEHRRPGVWLSDRIGLCAPIFAADFGYLRDTVQALNTSPLPRPPIARDLVPKLTIPSPSVLYPSCLRGGIDPEVYPDPEEFWSDLADAYATQLTGIAELGCDYLQLDDPVLGCLNDPQYRARLTAAGVDADGLLRRYVATINAALAGRPAGLRVVLHLCRGNYRSGWTADGGYEFVAEQVFGGAQVDGFLLEYDDHRCGDFEPLRFVPPGKRVFLGLVSTRHGQPESQDDLRRRIDEAAKVIPGEQLGLCPQCGFASTLEGNDLTRQEQQDKLALVARTAAEVWG